MNKKLLIAIAAFAVISTGYIGLRQYAISIIKTKLDNAISKVSSFAVVEYEEVDINPFMLDVYIKQVLIKSIDETKSLQIEEIALLDIDVFHRIPSFLSVEINGVQASIPKLNRGVLLLNQLGLKAVKANFALDYSLDASEKILEINNIEFGLEDVGKVAVSMKLGNIGVDKGTFLTELGALAEYSFHQATLNYTDQSLTDRVLVLVAKKKNRNFEDIKNASIAKLQAMINRKILGKPLEEKSNFEIKALLKTPNYVKSIKEIASTSPLERESYQAIISFLKNPDFIKIQSHPKRPETFSRIIEIEELQQLIDFLGISITSGDGAH